MSQIISHTDRVISWIIKKIETSEWKAHHRLPVEKDLAESIDVSRNSLREAIKALNVLGILETRQGDGTYVSSLSPQKLLAPTNLLLSLQGDESILEILSVRQLLEAESAYLSAIHISADELQQARELLEAMRQAMIENNEHDYMQHDIDFHKLIASSSGNETLKGLVLAFSDMTLYTRTRRLLADPDIQRQSLAEHETIYSYLESSSPDSARTAMKYHLDRVIAYQRRTKKENEESAG